MWRLLFLILMFAWVPRRENPDLAAAKALLKRIGG